MRKSFQTAFVSPQVDAAKGKGHAVARAVLFALRSGVLDRCEKVAKVTGRYFVRDFDGALDAVPPGAALVLQSTPSPWDLGDGVARSEVIGFRNDYDFVKKVLSDQDEAAGRPLERTLFLRAREAAASGETVAAFPPLRVPPTVNAEEIAVVTEL